MMGNHYHLVLRFDAEAPVSREELARRARAMYPEQRFNLFVAGWKDEEWERYSKRLFDLSEYMRNIQAAFARWYNNGSPPIVSWTHPPVWIGHSGRRSMAETCLPRRSAIVA